MKQKQFILLVNKANARIRSLEKHFDTEVYAVKQIRNMLDIEPIQGITKSGRISKKTYDEETQKRVISAINKFLGMETATVRGVKKARNNLRKNISDKLSDMTNEPSDKEIDLIYSLVIDKAVQRLQDKYRIGSDFWVMIQDAKSKVQNKDEFLEYMRQYIEYGNDKETVRDLNIVYNKYFR